MEFTLEMTNEHLTKLQKYSGADLYLAWQFANLDVDVSKIKVDASSRKLIEKARDRKIRFSAE